MIAVWMLYGLAWSLWLCAAAWAAERAMLAGRGPVRVVWIAAMVLSIAIPSVGYLRPRPAPNAVPIPTAALSVSSRTAATRIQPASIERPATRAHVPVLAWFDQIARANRPLAFAWIALSFGMLAYIVGGFVRLEILRRTWRPRTIDGVDVLISDDTGPALIGVWKTRIVLPRWALDIERDAFALMLRHELEHRLAGDTRLLAFAQLLLVLTPWNPMLWWQVRRLRLALELDCDMRVLRDRSEVASYGRLLLDLGRSRQSMHLLGASLADHATNLEARIRRMTQRARMTRPRAIAVALVAGVAAVAVGCQVPAPPTPAPSPMTTPNRAPEVAESSHRQVLDTLRNVRQADSLIERRSSARAEVRLQRVSRDSASASPDSTAAVPLVAQMFNATIGADTARDPAIRALYQQLVDSYAFSLNSVAQLRLTYMDEHPMVKEALRRARDARSNLESLMLSPEWSAATQAGPGCAAGPSRNGGALVTRFVSDEAGATAGRIVVRSQATTDNHFTVEANGPICSSAGVAEIQVFGALDGPPIVIRTSWPTSMIVATRSGRVLAGPVAIQNSERQYELTWPAR